MTAATLEFADPRTLEEMQRVYWPSLLGGALAAAVLPWSLGSVDVDVRPALRLLLIGGFAAVVLVQWAEVSTRPFLRAAPYVAGVLLLVTLWYLLGAFKTPGFLMLLMLPVLGAALTSRGWLEYGVTALAVLGIWTIALVTSPELQWYVGSVTGDVARLAMLDTPALDALRLESSFAGHEQFVILSFFAVTLAGVALLGRTAARTIERLSDELHEAVVARRETEQLAAGLVEVSDEIEAFVVRDTGEVVNANDAFARELGGIEMPATIFERLAPEYPEDLKRLLAARDGGELRHWACRTARGYRVLDVSVRPFAIAGRDCSRVRLRDAPHGEVVAAAIEHLAIGIAVLGADHRVLAANRELAALFPLAAPGTAAARALDGVYGLPDGWWDIAPRPRALSRFESGGKRYLVLLVLAGSTMEVARTLLHVEPDPSDA